MEPLNFLEKIHSILEENDQTIADEFYEIKTSAYTTSSEYIAMIYIFFRDLFQKNNPLYIKISDEIENFFDYFRRQGVTINKIG
jgi:hypothetical protein